MTTLREAAQQALEYLDAPSAKLWPAGTQHRIITALRAALVEPVQEPVAWNNQEQKTKRAKFEPIRIRIMQEAYDLADRDDSEGYNSVKVMCSEVLSLIDAFVQGELTTDAPPHRKPEPVVNQQLTTEPVQQGCAHCNHPLYAAIKCRVCGRVTSEHLTTGSEHLGSEQMAEPVAWYHVPYPNNGFSPMVSLSKQHEPSMYGAVVPLFLGPPHCPNCASLEAQNTELDRKLAEMEAKLNNQNVDDAFRILAEANRRAIDYINHLEAENAKLRKGPV